MKPSVRLDDVDRRILRALQDDGSLSQTALSDMVGASPASCWRRTRALEEAGILTKTVRLANAERLGRGMSVMVQVRLKSHATELRSAFEDFLRSQPEIMECHSMSGDWDYLMRIVVGSVADYQSFLMGQLLAHANVDTSTSHFALGQIKYTTALPI